MVSPHSMVMLGLWTALCEYQVVLDLNEAFACYLRA